MNESVLNFSQQRALFSPDLVRPVTLIGAGSVGSNIAPYLCRIGVTDLTVYDAQSIESTNIPSSHYGLPNFNTYKVDALAAILLRDTGVAIKTKRKEYEGERLRGTVICCVDSMEARQLIWRAVHQNPFVDIFIDTRTAWEFWQVFTVRPCKPQDIAYYEPFVAYNSAGTVPESCGTHGIIYASIAVAAEAVKNLSKFWEDGKKHTHIERVCGSSIFINDTE